MAKKNPSDPAESPAPDASTEQNAPTPPAPDPSASSDQPPAPPAPAESVIPLFLTGTVHVVRDGKTHAVRGDVLVQETELTEEEIDELTARRRIRAATAAELAAAAQRRGA